MEPTSMSRVRLMSRIDCRLTWALYIFKTARSLNQKALTFITTAMPKKRIANDDPPM